MRVRRLIVVNCGGEAFSAFSFEGAGGGTVKGFAIGGCAVRGGGPTCHSDHGSGLLHRYGCHGNDGRAERRAGSRWPSAILTIGGPTAADRNIISGNQGFGIDMNAGGGTIENNCIGTDVTGTRRAAERHRHLRLLGRIQSAALDRRPGRGEPDLGQHRVNGIRSTAAPT